MIQFELADIIQLAIIIFIAGGFYAATQNKMKNLKGENDSLKTAVGALGDEMKTMHSEQAEEIKRIERDNHEIQTNVAVMVEGQKSMKEILLRMEISWKEHIDKK